MFIKKARFYKWSDQAQIPQEALEAFRFTEMAKSEATKMGFHPAIGQNLIHESGGHKLIMLRTDSKILPPQVINMELLKRAEARSLELGRPVGRKERQQLKEDVITDLLPQAFVGQKYTHAIITKSGYVIVNGSSSEAENILCLLRKALGSLAVMPLSGITKERPDFELTEAVKQQKNSDLFQLGAIFEFQGSDDVALKFKGLSADSEEVQGATEYGMATKAELSSRHGICFTLKDDCSISGINWSEQLESRVDGDDAAAVFDSQFFIAAETLGGVADDLIQMFGGLKSGT